MTRSILFLLLVVVAAPADAQTARERRDAIRKAAAENPAKRVERAAQALVRVDAHMEASKAAQGDPRAALIAMQSLRDVLRSSPEGEVRAAALLRVAPVESLVNEAIASQPDEAATLLLEKASLLFHAGRKGEVEALIVQSNERRMNKEATLALLGIYGRRNDRALVAPLCQSLRPRLFREKDVFELLDACIRASGALTPESGLTWAAQEDKAAYFQELDRRAEAGRAQAPGARPAQQ